jgi:hypothetical protein
MIPGTVLRLSQDFLSRLMALVPSLKGLEIEIAPLPSAYALG